MKSIEQKLNKTMKNLKCTIKAIQKNQTFKYSLIIAMATSVLLSLYCLLLNDLINCIIFLYLAIIILVLIKANKLFNLKF